MDSAVHDVAFIIDAVEIISRNMKQMGIPVAFSLSDLIGSEFLSGILAASILPVLFYCK